jgi:group I intron endonuclease
MKNSLNPVATYSNPDLQKDKIYSENRQAGIYRWTNKINGKIYIGSSQNISKRFSQYSNPNYLKRNTSMPICRALLKHGYENFDFSIIEYCEVQDLMDREEYYLNIL